MDRKSIQSNLSKWDPSKWETWEKLLVPWIPSSTGSIVLLIQVTSVKATTSASATNGDLSYCHFLQLKFKRVGIRAFGLIVGQIFSRSHVVAFRSLTHQREIQKCPRQIGNQIDLIIVSLSNGINVSSDKRFVL
jgi:hypothetical protein